jgi:hypothetical protein
MQPFATRSTALAALAGLLFAQSGLADSASGKFEMDGKSFVPTSAAAFRVRDQANPREFATYVMLSTKPMNLEAIAASNDAYMTAINDEAVLSADHIGFQVGKDGTVVMNSHFGGTQYIDSSGSLMGEKGSLVSSCTTNTPERVACSVASAKTVKTMDGDSWTVDIKFDSAVVARAPGKPLQKDGGEPGKAFVALVAAAPGDDLGKIIAVLAPQQAENFERDYNTPEENLASAHQMFEFLLPKEARITGGELRDEDTALLEVEAAPYPGAKVLYVVEMQRTEGRWGFASSQMVGNLK